MNRTTVLGTAASLAVAAAIAGSGASAAAQSTAARPHPHALGDAPAVFALRDNPSGNSIAVFARHGDGRLSLVHVVATGGDGAVAAGASADPLASQGALSYDAADHLLLAVNAGSGSLSVFSVAGTALKRLQVLATGGAFPNSVAVAGDLVYVLDAGGSGAVTGFRISDGRLQAIAGSDRSLALANASTPNFLAAPGEVGFSPDHRALIVTTKASTSAIDVFSVDASGLLSAAPVVTSVPGAVPFAFSFSASGALVVAEAATSTVATFHLNADDTLTSLATVANGQKALCWITASGGRFYAANAASATLSSYTVSASGTPALLAASGVAAGTDPGAIDLAATNDGHDLYVQAGGVGAIDEFRINADGSLSALGSVAGLGAEEGIVAS